MIDWEARDRVSTQQWDEMKAFLPSIAEMSQWDQIWDTVRTQFPTLQITLPGLDRMTAPYGQIRHGVDIHDDGHCYTVRRWQFSDETVRRLGPLTLLLGKGDYQEVADISYEEISSALEQLGLPVDGWSNTYQQS